ncbi:hypothetical protein [Streptomyces prasinopilosus]|uniref:hypothetical protein n=1 Tax=Streptomyces prasinopilosus TaxID=67344 RepID=UPI0006EBD2D5|nr:hypothetical protein [Streptomyces prasinopilosus]
MTETRDLPDLPAIRAITTFVEIRTEEAEQSLQRYIPHGQHFSTDALELLSLPRALRQAAQTAAWQLTEQLTEHAGADEEAAWQLWCTLLHTVRPFHRHPDLPEAARIALAAYPYRI